MYTSINQLKASLESPTNGRMDYGEIWELELGKKLELDHPVKVNDIYS